MSSRWSFAKAQFTVENIGGIDETEVSFEPGVTILAGRNATNRTSLLRAITAALGTDDIPIKTDADQAYAGLTVGDETYNRQLERRNETVHTSGDPYLEDATLANLFAYLLESNEARRAVATGTNLRDIIMRPIDTDEIEAEIDRFLSERHRIDEKLEEIEDLKNQLPALEKERTQIQSQIEEKNQELEQIEVEIEAADTDVEQSREERTEFETKLEELRATRSTLNDVRYELETEQNRLETLRAEKREVKADYEDLPETAADDLEELETRINDLRARKQTLESELNEIQSVIGFNQEQLEEGADGLLETPDVGDEAVTDELVPGESVTCWTCGSEVNVNQIETTIEKLQTLSRETVDKINKIESELDELKNDRDQYQDQQRQRERLDRRRYELEDEIEATEERIETLSNRRENLRGEVKATETEVEALENETREEVLELHKKANQLEYDLGSLENDLERVSENITTIEERLGEESHLKKQRSEINAEIEKLRTRIDRIEQQAIEEFNTHMETILELLEFDNLARIWLEQIEQEVREGRQTVTKSIFELHIIRETDSGAAYEDTIDNLSESEREVTGLIFALAGYLAHEVYETVPFMLLDSLEAIDSDRIALIINYFQEYCEYLVVALLPEDAEALAEDYTRISNI